MWYLPSRNRSDPAPDSLCHAGHVLDYGEANIGGSSYLLPRRSIGYTQRSDPEAREEIEYRDCRKFGSDANIVFPTEGTPESEGR